MKKQTYKLTWFEKDGTKHTLEITPDYRSECTDLQVRVMEKYDEIVRSEPMVPSSINLVDGSNLELLWK